MRIINVFKIAINGLKANRTRSALTILGIVIGISAVVTMMSLGGGAQNLILGQIVSMGSNNIFVEPGPMITRMGGGQGMQSAVEEFEIKTLTVADAEAIAKNPNVDLVAPMVMGVNPVIYGDIDQKITFLGITPAENQISGHFPILGRDITDDDVTSMARVAVLGYKIRQDLFGDENPIDKIIRIQKINFRVVGVMEEQGMQMFQNLDEYIFIPISTAQKLLLGIDYIRMIIVKVVSENKIDETIADIQFLLRQRHNIYNPEGDLSKDDFKVISQKETADILSTVTSVLTIFLSSVAAIALVVGGIGIMNIMLVSVNERTKEIGLRKAVGARKKDILNQFLLEAISLTIVGGVIGIVLGLLGSYLGSVILGRLANSRWGFTMPISSIILAFGVSTAIGLIFGIYPARRAANLHPIDALRYE